MVRKILPEVLCVEGLVGSDWVLVRHVCRPASGRLSSSTYPLFGVAYSREQGNNKVALHDSEDGVN